MDDRVIVRVDESVCCPKCSAVFALKEGIARHVIEQYRDEFDAQAKAFREEIAAEVTRDADRRAAQQFTVRITDLQDQVAGAKRSEREAKEAIEKARTEARIKAQADAEQQRRGLEDDIKIQGAELQRLRDQELELRRQRQALEQGQKDLELNLQRRLDEERISIAQQISERESERFRQQDADFRKRLDDVQRANDELRRKLEQGSQQSQGEVLELQVEQSLTTGFIHDLIEEVKKGVRGADVIQTVRTLQGQVAGTIIWEAKRAENWSEKWLDKLKDDQREAKADLAVLVTTAFPRNATAPMARIGDVWVISPQVLRPMAETLRVILLEAHKLRQANTGRSEKAELLYDYLAGASFSHRLRTVLDSRTCEIALR
jgi:hypothetical protein